MNFVPIPLEALESQGFLDLSLSDQKFLIDLYVTHHDCERFTIDMDQPEQYRQPAGATLQRKVRGLLAAGLIRVVGAIGRPDHARRVFTFTYPAFNAVVLQQEKEAA
jgi:hypothetical protein